MKKRDLTPLKNNKTTPLEIKGAMLCRKACAEGSVLLKNNDVLPISPRPVALFGFGARHTMVRGIGSGDIAMRYLISVEQGLENAGFNITTKKWLDHFDKIYAEHRLKLGEELREESKKTGIDCLHLLYARPHVLISSQDITDGDIAAANTDTAIYVLTRKEGEGIDRRYAAGEYLLSEHELNQLKKLKASFKKFILLLNIGAVIDTKEILEIGPDAVILMFQGSGEIGNAVADMLTGNIAPSGKLTSTWAKDYWDYPNSDTFGENDGDIVNELYHEGIYVGYRYFDSFNIEPQYAFGYGKTYTTFSIKSAGLTITGSICNVNVNVTNTGSTAGKEVVQVYLSAPQGTLDKPYQQLCAFAKTAMLRPGDTDHLTISFRMEEQASFDMQRGVYLLEAGNYIVRIGNSSRSTKVCGIVRLAGERITRKVDNLFKRPIMFDDLTSSETKNISYSGEQKEIEDAPVYPMDVDAIPAYGETAYSSTPVNYFAGQIDPGAVNTGEGKNVFLEVSGDISLAKVKCGEYTVEQLVASMNEEGLCHLVVGQEYIHEKYKMNSVSTHVMGACGETTNYFLNRESLGEIPYTIVADGPAGLRLINRFQTDPEGNIVFIDPVLSYEDGEFGEDGYIDGYENYYQYVTGLPIATQLASTWNIPLLNQLGNVVGSEMERYDIDVLLAPSLNIHRNPLCGRNFENFSEDPYVSAMAAIAIVKGIQVHPGRGATLKHMAASNQEAGRTSHNSLVSERTMREIYLKGFELAIKYSNPYAIMTSLNCVNGPHGANSKDIATYVVRDEWQYKGLIMTDWNTTTPARGASTVGCINSGNDLIMPGSEDDITRLKAALHNKTDKGDVVTLGALQKCAINVLKYILRTTRL